MSKQYKKLQKKIYQKPQQKKRQQKPVGHDYLLTGIFIFTLVVTVIGWNGMDWLNRIMYLLLALSFGLTLFQRHGKNLSDEARTKISLASTVSVVAAIVMFLIVIFFQFTK